MGEMKNKMMEAAEVFQKCHPEFTMEEAESYVMFHNDFDYWLGYEKKVSESRPIKRKIQIECETEEEAIKMAERIGLSFHYNCDYLNSKFIIKVEEKMVKFLFFEEMKYLPIVLIPGESKNV